MGGLVAGFAIVACQPTGGYFAPAPGFKESFVSHSALPAIAEPRIVKAEVSEWKISLASDTVTAGSITLRIHNAGTMPHVFEIEGKGIEKRTRPIPPDSTVALTVDVKAGKYEVYCPLAGGAHKKMGMEADLAVAPAK